MTVLIITLNYSWPPHCLRNIIQTPMTSFPSVPWLSPLRSLVAVDQTFLETLSLLPLLANITSYFLGFYFYFSTHTFLVFFPGLVFSVHLRILVISRSPYQLSDFYHNLSRNTHDLKCIYIVLTSECTLSYHSSLLKLDIDKYLSYKISLMPHKFSETYDIQC